MTSPAAGESPGTERKLFVLLLLLQAAFYAYLIGDRRMVRPMDTWACYALQHFVASHASSEGGNPLWIPYLSQGMASNWYLCLQGGMFQNAACLAGPLLAGANFIPLFHVGLFFDELLLVTGMWLLMGRFSLSPAARFFAGVATVGSSMWADQLFFTLRSVAAFPMILYLLESTLTSGSRAKLAAAVNLLALQLLGSVPYAVVFSAVLAAFYLGLRVWIGPRDLAPAAAWKPRAGDCLWLPLSLVGLACVAVSLFHGLGSIVTLIPGREADNTANPDAFLAWGGSVNPLRYARSLLALSPSMEPGLFCGYATLACAALAHLHSRLRRVATLYACLLFCVLFTMGSLALIAALLYQSVPGMNYYRYVGHAATFVKLFLILLSAFGAEVLIRSCRARAGSLRLPGALLAVIAGLLWAVAAAGAAGSDLLPGINALLQGTSRGLTYPELVRPGALGRLVLWDALGATVCSLVVLLLGASRAPSRALVATLLVVHALDVYGWRFRHFDHRTDSLDDAAFALHRLTPPDFVARRSDEYALNPRHEAMKGAFSWGGYIHVTDVFLRMDPVSSRYYTQVWPGPLNDLLQAAAHGRIEQDRVMGSLEAGAMSFTVPRARPGFLAACGAARDKLQFFSRAVLLPRQEVARVLGDPSFTGNQLLLEGDPPARAATHSDDRLEVPYEVLEFAADRLVLRFTLPGAGGWVHYADGWHPDWSARVNGRERPLYRSSLAFKAVSADGGLNVVEFRMRSPARSAAFALLQILSAAGVILVTGVALRIASGRA